jgi:hypothetical protein
MRHTFPATTPCQRFALSRLRSCGSWAKTILKHPAPRLPVALRRWPLRDGRLRWQFFPVPNTVSTSSRQHRTVSGTIRNSDGYFAMMREFALDGSRDGMAPAL